MSATVQRQVFTITVLECKFDNSESNVYRENLDIHLFTARHNTDRYINRHVLYKSKIPTIHRSWHSAKAKYFSKNGYTAHNWKKLCKDKKKRTTTTKGSNKKERNKN